MPRPDLASMRGAGVTQRAIDALVSEQEQIERTQREHERQQELAQVQEIERLLARDETSAIPRLSQIRALYDARRDAGRVALAALAEFVSADRAVQTELDRVGDSLSASYRFIPQTMRRDRFSRLRAAAGLSPHHGDDSLYLVAGSDSERVALTCLYSIVNKIIDAGVVNVGGKTIRFDV